LPGIKLKLNCNFQSVDGQQELEKGKKSLGTTKKGIGPAYSSKASRTGIRVSDLLGDFELFKEKYTNLVHAHLKLFPNLTVNIEEELERYKGYAVKVAPFVSDTVHYLSDQLKQNKRVLVEGANAAMLDLDFGECHGK